MITESSYLFALNKSHETHYLCSMSILHNEQSSLELQTNFQLQTWSLGRKSNEKIYEVHVPLASLEKWRV